MKICNICNKISATDQDHIDCVEKRRMNLEDKDMKNRLGEKMNLSENPQDLGVEIKAILKHLSKEKNESS